MFLNIYIDICNCSKICTTNRPIMNLCVCATEHITLLYGTLLGLQIFTTYQADKCMCTWDGEASVADLVIFDEL